jgi:hypothetical protein
MVVPAASTGPAWAEAVNEAMSEAVAHRSVARLDGVCMKWLLSRRGDLAPTRTTARACPWRTHLA